MAKRLLYKDEAKYKKEEIKMEAKVNEEGFSYTKFGKGIAKNGLGTGIPGSFLKRKGKK